MSGLEAQWAELPRYLAGHIQLTLVSLTLAIVTSLPLGVLATRHPRLETIALAVASVLQTIPGLALLALMVPLLGLLAAVLEGWGYPGLPSIGFLPAVLALSLYGLLPILRNTVTGIAGVDAAYVEAARGVGMSPREVLWKVELPLAMPTVVAGIRTATVWGVGMATLATPVGGTSLGNPIFAGLQTRNLSAVLMGSLAAALLALLLDGLVRLVEVGLTRRSPSRIGLAVVLGLAIAFGAFAPGLAGGMRGSGESASAGPVVAIGSKSFTEQYLLAEILAGVLEAEPGVRVRRVSSLGSTVAFDALVAGDLDLYVDYSGTLWATILRRDTVDVDRDRVLEIVRSRLAEEYDVRVVASLGFENTYALAMRAEDADRLGIARISDLAARAPELEILGDYEFFDRPEWRAIETRYGLRFDEERAMDSSLMYEALRSGNGDVIAAYSTDGRIVAYDLRVLEDDLRVIPPYDALVLASGRFVRAQPGLSGRLADLEGRLGAGRMRRLNAAVDLSGLAPAAVAREWLEGCFLALADVEPEACEDGDRSGTPSITPRPGTRP